MGGAVTLAGGALAYAAPNDTILVSRAPDTNEPRTGALPSVSADGNRIVYFAAERTHVRDVQAGTTTIADRADGADGAVANSQSLNQEISSNGRFVLFESEATNLSDDANSNTRNVYVRDLQEHTTVLVNRETGSPGDAADAGSFSIAGDISADGRFVAFSSNAANLGGDTVLRAYVRDLQTNTTMMVGRRSNGDPTTASTHAISISDDGNRVLFYSADTGLPGNSSGVGNVFVRDVAAGTTELASRADGASGETGNGSVQGSAISGDGRKVAFASMADNLSADDTDDQTDLHLRDFDTSRTELISRASGADGAKANAFTDVRVGISRGGRLVSFHSRATNLSTADEDDHDDVFVRDRQTDRTLLVSRASGAEGEPGNADSQGPRVAGDGRFVAFSSHATNLTADDTPDGTKVYRRELPAEATTDPGTRPDDGATDPRSTDEGPAPDDTGTDDETGRELDGDDGGSEAGDVATTGEGALPFTGLPLAWMILAGGALIAGGALLRVARKR